MFMENKIEKKLKKWNLNGDIVRDNISLFLKYSSIQRWKQSSIN